MARWYPLGITRQPLGPCFEAPNDKAAAETGAALYGIACVGVISVLRWEDELEVAQTTARMKVREG